jgi:hypothetical protein
MAVARHCVESYTTHKMSNQYRLEQEFICKEGNFKFTCRRSTKRTTYKETGKNQNEIFATHKLSKENNFAEAVILPLFVPACLEHSKSTKQKIDYHAPPLPPFTFFGIVESCCSCRIH